METETVPRGLDELIADRTAELTAYQNARYAEDYRRFVHHVRDREHAATGTEELTEAVARNLFKLMAYKDEYEVARLSLDPEVLAGVREQWGAGARVSYRLHPPVLRALGMRRKIALGPWFRPVFRVLRGMRGLRGTPFDPFGRAHVRKVERELIGEYRRAVEEGLPSLTGTTLPGVVELAELPDMIRGYEQIKLDSVQRYRQRLAELRDTRTHTDLTAQALP
ncbi:hypothetical protein REH65_32125 [Saccharopolyspora sp. ID03-671]|uniref:DUF6537 domain-containing protein n=1 Tax=Saccharopolyspora sp. ID03-671 TaxID=3073066 RepID=UPI0032539356